jgi:CDGSH-type Zn-finger protein
MTSQAADEKGMWIVVSVDGPYTVHGNVPLVRKVQVVSEYGEPLTWKKEGTLATPRTYALCRCGRSGSKPFCDSAHLRAHFNGSETADPRPIVERQVLHAGSTGIVVRRDYSLCTESGFCGTRWADIEDLVSHTDDPQVRAQVMRMIENCPSGSLTYKLEEGQPDVEVDLPRQVAATIEITDDGPIEGPLWVTGEIPVQRADGRPLETRNRVTLCSCGRSRNKPLCDGTHRRERAPLP